LEEQVTHNKVNFQHRIIIDANSFASIYDRYWEMVYRICYNNIRDVETAKEMVQDIFKSIWERKNSLVINISMERYLLRSAKLKVFEYIRNKTCQKKHIDCIRKEYCDVSNCTENSIFFNNLTEKVNDLIDRLPCQCRNVYRMSRKEGLTNKEIASALLISERAVEQHLTKALRMLRENLLEYKI